MKTGILNLPHGLAAFGLGTLLLLGGRCPAIAQWLTQTNHLKPGWNAVYLHVDASHDSLQHLVGDELLNPIEEIWYWRPNLPTGQFVESPQLPTDTGSQWIEWSRALGPLSELTTLTGNSAYLVRVGGGANYEWKVKGRPLLPTYRWTLSGLNFLGFPTPTTPSPSFESWLAGAPELQANAEIFRYQGGDLSATNPVQVFAFRTTPVSRDQAYWVRSGDTYNDYFGPIQIRGLGPVGIAFGANHGQARFWIRNTAAVPVTVTMDLLPSEPPPSGEPSVIAPPFLLMRGALNVTNLTYAFIDLNSNDPQWDLAAEGEPGSEVEVVVGFYRQPVLGFPGDYYAGLLRLTDSLGLAQVDIGVTADRSSNAGLWVGKATVNQVSHYLKTFATATNTTDFQALLARLQLVEGVDGYHYEWVPENGRVLVFGGPEQRTGSYLLEGPVRVDSGNVARPYPLRLILHNNGFTSRLLQKVYHGVGLGTNVILTTRESLLLPSELASARRLSAVHLPTSVANVPWDVTGQLRAGSTLNVTVPLAFDDQSSNPFLHTYHPDHDNLDALFDTPLPVGRESYGVTRQITMQIDQPGNHFDGLTGGIQDRTGTYIESITIQASATYVQTYDVLGTFALKRISDIDTLTTQ